MLDSRKSSNISSFELPLDSPKTCKISKKQSATKAEEPKVVLSAGEWRCTACTVTNKQGSIRCIVCGKLAGRDVRQQVKQQDDTTAKPSVEVDQLKYDQRDKIIVKFNDPASRPYTVVAAVPCDDRDPTNYTMQLDEGEQNNTNESIACKSTQDT